MPSIISSDMVIRGELTGAGDLQIEGKVYGRIDVGHLVLADGGVVEGEIVAKAVRISGALTGTISAASVTLSSTAKVQGDITHDVLVMEAGAQLEGAVRRNNGTLNTITASAPNKLLSAPMTQGATGEG